MPTRKKTSHATSVDGYEQFLRSLKLFDVRLRSATCKLDLPEYARIFESKREPVMQIAADYLLERTERNFFDAVAKFRLQVREQKADKMAVMIECEFQAHVHGTNLDRGNFAERFKESGFRMIVWPYFRQFVADVTARMSIPPITVPLSTEG